MRKLIGKAVMFVSVLFLGVSFARAEVFDSMGVYGPTGIRNGDTVVVELRQDKLQQPAWGYQVFLEYNKKALTFVSHEHNNDVAVFPIQFIANINEDSGVITLVAGVNYMGGNPQPTNVDAWLDRITFIVTNAKTAEVRFRPVTYNNIGNPNWPPSRWTNPYGAPIYPYFTTYYGNEKSKGDQNIDGKVDFRDRARFMAHYQENRVIVAGDDLGVLSDIVKDGVVNSLDKELFDRNCGVVIKKKSNEKKTSLP
jgi:hypothetical protein